MPADLFLTSVVAVRAPLTEGGAAPAPDAPTPGSVILLEVSGAGYKDKVTSSEPIIEFRNALRQSGSFGESSDLQKLPTPGPDEYLREFKLNLVLKAPLTT